MRYFYDTEFLEGTQKTGFFRRKETVPTIDLISIGIVAEDGREYYAVSKEFNLKEAWNRYDWKYQDYHPTILPETRKEKVYWIRENVLKPLHKQLAEIEGKNNLFHEHYDFFSYSSLKYLIRKHGKTRKEIADDVLRFCMPEYDFKEGYTGMIHQLNGYWIKDNDKNPELYGYYSAYDHVALCWLFGKMINLPEGFPMYTYDLKQELDRRVQGYCEGRIPFEKGLQTYKDNDSYPKQENEHHALADARWNRKLYDFLNSF